MKRIIVIAVILFSTSVLYAQNDAVFHKHEVKIAFGEAKYTSEYFFEIDNRVRYKNLSFSYLYRPEIYFWAGANFINYVGEKIYYNWREYDVDGSFKDFSKSKMKYFAIIAPEIRFSCLNKKAVIIYGALSGGIGFENGYDTQRQKYPKKLFPCFHISYFGLSGNFGKNSNIFLGGELGIGFKGLASIHGGYRF